MSRHTDPARYTVFILLKATTAWLRLDHDARAAAGRDAFGSGFPDMSLRYYDAEAFTGRCSDVLVVETPSLADHRMLMDRLRDSAIFREPYFEVVDIIPSVSDAYRESDAG